MSWSKEKLDIFSQNLLEFDQTVSSQTDYSDWVQPVQNTRKRTMTQKGLEYTKTMKRKAAMSKAKEFSDALADFKIAIATTRNQDELKNKVKTKIEQYKVVMHAFEEYLQLVVDPLESSSITEAQNEIKAIWEELEGPFKYAQQRLRELEEEDTRSISSRGTQKSIRSRRSSQSSSTSTKDTLISIKARKAVLQERLKFTDTIKEQEKTLTKLKLEQQISETLAEEAIYEAEVSEESIVDRISHLPKDSFTTMHRFLNSGQSPDMLVSQTSREETFKTVNATTTAPSTPHVEISVPNTTTHNVVVHSNHIPLSRTPSTSVYNPGTTLSQNATNDNANQTSPASL